MDIKNFKLFIFVKYTFQSSSTSRLPWVFNVHLEDMDLSGLEESWSCDWLFKGLPLDGAGGPVDFADTVGVSPIFGRS